MQCSLPHFWHRPPFKAKIYHLLPVNFQYFFTPSLVKEGERGIKYASLHFLCDSTYPGKRIFKMTEICQVHGDIAYLSQRKQNFLEHLRNFHWFLWSSFAQNIIIQANHIKTLLIIHLLFRKSDRILAEKLESIETQ